MTSQRDQDEERHSRVGAMIDEFQRARKRRLMNAVVPAGPPETPDGDAPVTDSGEEPGAPSDPGRPRTEPLDSQPAAGNNPKCAARRK